MFTIRNTVTYNDTHPPTTNYEQKTMNFFLEIRPKYAIIFPQLGAAIPAVLKINYDQQTMNNKPG